MLKVAGNLFSLVNPANSRDEQIDMARGWVMLLVVLHHSAFVSQGDVFSLTCQSLILGFHMPFFFLLNGYLFHLSGSAGKYTFKEYVRKRIVRLVLPYFIFEFINLALSYLVIPVLHNHIELGDALVSIVTCINDKAGYSGVCNRLWFLPCLFVSDVFAFIILRATKRKLVIWGAALAAAGASYALHATTGCRLPFTVDTALMGTCFVLIGYCTGAWIQRLTQGNTPARNWATALVLSIPYAGFVYMNPDLVKMFDNTYGNYACAVIGSMLAYAAVMAAAKAFADAAACVRSGRVFQFFRKLLLWLGINSLAVFLVHVWLARIFRYTVCSTPPWNLLIFALTLAVCIPAVNFVCSYMPFLLGVVPKRK